MTTLRVLLANAPSSERAEPWALFDAQGRVVREGRAVPAAWPAAARREAVLSASAVRIAELRLPPMSPDRVAAAAAYALEDQLAGPAHDQHIAVSDLRRDGRAQAFVASRALVASLASQFSRVVAEPALAPPPPPSHWGWFASGATGGFVRKPDGSAFSVRAANADDDPPAELTWSLAHAVRSGTPVKAVEVAFAFDAAALARYAATTGVPFQRTQPWRWVDTAATVFAATTDLLQHEFARLPRRTARASIRAFKTPAIVAIAALGLHVIATLGHWAWLRIDEWRTAQAIAAVAHAAGIGAAEGDSAAALLARRHTGARHRAGLAAPGDALPLLATIAPALAALPERALKTAVYADDHWTFEFGKLDATEVIELERRIKASGLNALQATTAAGMRMRVTPAL
ncbi:MAG: type II secretion system protein GspL [Casimicrobiaceae bacterium]